MRVEYSLGLVLLLITTVSAADESFPYKVAVKAAVANVRSGPGFRYYSTAVLRPGDEVEVYERRHDGWLGIRPLETSFNWVEANNVRMTDDPDLANVLGDNAVAWVGSELGDIEDHRWQVKLDAGEPVHLLSKKPMSIFRGDQQRDYYRIAPPAGDFRWVHERDVKPLAERAALVQPPSEVQLAQFQVAEDATEVSEARHEQRHGFIDPDNAPPGAPSARVASLAPRTGFRPGEQGGSDFDSLAKLLDVELSESVAKDPSQWKLVSLRLEAEALVEQSESTLHRGKARLLLERIKEFETLQQRYAGIDQLEPDVPQPAPVTAQELGADASSSDYEPRFDGRGWLLPVHSSRQASPPYALLDQQGQILTFVTPAPGLNLHRYLRKQVGIFGQRSRYEFLNKPHLTADRIVDIDRHRR